MPSTYSPLCQRQKVYYHLKHWLSIKKLNALNHLDCLKTDDDMLLEQILQPHEETAIQLYE
jgi:hypothetical protein